MTAAHTSLEKQLALISKAKRILVPVMGKNDVLYARITKQEAKWLVETVPGNYMLIDNNDGDVCIERNT